VATEPLENQYILVKTFCLDNETEPATYSTETKCRTFGLDMTHRCTRSSVSRSAFVNRSCRRRCSAHDTTMKVSTSDVHSPLGEARSLWILCGRMRCRDSPLDSVYWHCAMYDPVPVLWVTSPYPLSRLRQNNSQAWRRF